jgi:hypothetical protein
MLTSEEIESMRMIHAGATPPHQHELSSLIDKGYVIDNAGSYALSEEGHRRLSTLESYGDAIVDAILPGAGSDPSADPATAASK